MRVLLASLVLVIACGKDTSTPKPPPAYRFLPANPELVVRLDLTRVRAWPHYAKVAPRALADIEKLLAAARDQCKLDVMAEATSVIIAKRGPLLSGDLVAIASGLNKDKVTSCLATILASGSVVKLTLEDNLVQVRLGERSLASGAVLPSGDVVLVARNGAGVDPAAWKTEVTQGVVALPAWLGDLDLRAPIAVRSETEKRAVTATIVLEDPLVLHGRVTSPSAAAAASDVKAAQAIANYLDQGKAGTGRVEPSGVLTFLDYTASGPEIDNLLAIALPALFGAETDRDLAATVTGPAPTCALLPDAVDAYIKQTLATAPPNMRADMEAKVVPLLPQLKQAFVDNCTKDAWAPASITCHVDNKDRLARFEKCSQTLTAEQRGRLEAAVKAALAPAAVPTPAAGSGSAAGSAT